MELSNEPQQRTNTQGPETFLFCATRSSGKSMLEEMEENPLCKSKAGVLHSDLDRKRDLESAKKGVLK